MERGREGGRNEDACYVRQGQHVRKYFFLRLVTSREEAVYTPAPETDLRRRMK